MIEIIGFMIAVYVVTRCISSLFTTGESQVGKIAWGSCLIATLYLINTLSQQANSMPSFGR
jgi:hypothetical protein